MLTFFSACLEHGQHKIHHTGHGEKPFTNKPQTRAMNSTVTCQPPCARDQNPFQTIGAGRSPLHTHLHLHAPFLMWKLTSSPKTTRSSPSRTNTQIIFDAISSASVYCVGLVSSEANSAQEPSSMPHFISAFAFFVASNVWGPFQSPRLRLC